MKKGLTLLMPALMMMGGSNLSSQVSASEVAEVTQDDLYQVREVIELILKMKGFFYSVDGWHFKGPDYKENMDYFERNFYRLISRGLTSKTREYWEKQFKKVKGECCTHHIVQGVWGFVK